MEEPRSTATGWDGRERKAEMTLDPVPGGEFVGWRVIVTGGSSGIGLATGRRFARRGANVVSLDLARPDDAEDISWQRCDVAQDRSVRIAVARAIDGLGGLDVSSITPGSGCRAPLTSVPIRPRRSGGDSLR